MCKRHLEDSNKTLCAPGTRATTETDQTCLWMFECLLCKHRSAVACFMERGSGFSKPGAHSMWHKLSWRMFPLAPPLSHWAEDPQTAEQLYQRNSHTVKEILGSTTDFPTWGSGNGTENLQGIRFWKTEGLDYRTSIRLGKQTLGGHKQNLVCNRSQEKRAVSPHVTELEFPVRIQESLVEAWVNTLASGQTIGREHSLPHQQKIGFKITEGGGVKMAEE